MKAYTYTEERAKKIIKSQALSRIPMIIIALSGGFYIANIQSDGHLFDDKSVLLIAGSIAVMASFLGFIIGIKKGVKALMLNKYIISDAYIDRYTPSGDFIRLEFSKIDKHQVIKKGLLLKASTKKILIPSGLDNYDEISKVILDKLK
jgi:hypothetical protein